MTGSLEFTLTLGMGSRMIGQSDGVRTSRTPAPSGGVR